jgi:hypothetical protein
MNGGAIDLGIWGGLNAMTADFDNVTVYNLNSPLPPPTNTIPTIQSITKRIVATQGSNFTLNVTAAGYPLNYQWYFGGDGGIAIAGATNSSCTITNAKTSNAGLYTVWVTNNLGKVYAQANVSTFTTNILANCGSTTGQTTVTLAWCPSPSTNVIASYQLYSGTGTTTGWTPSLWQTNPFCPAVLISQGTNWFRSYTFLTNVGNVLTSTISGLTPGTWYFAATAIDTNGLESDFSDEASKTLVAGTNTISTNFTLNIYWLAVYGCPAIQTKMCPLQNGTLWYRTNLVLGSWKSLTNWVGDSYGNVVYDDVGAVGSSQRFYRASTP